MSVCLSDCLSVCVTLRHPKTPRPVVDLWSKNVITPLNPPLAQVRPYSLQPGGGIAACDTG